jgi:pimeloyl-ACP methyl ester carboxylesterase
MDSFVRDGLIFDVRDEGPENGIAVVLLHGFPQDSTSWDSVVEPLHAAGYRTLAPDQRGYSPRARPTRIKAYRQSELVDDVAALLDAAGLDRAHVVGHDWGGIVAWAFASKYPDRCLTLTSLSTPHPGAFRSVAFSSTQLLKSWYMAMFQVPKLSEAILRPGGPAWQALVTGLPPHQAQHYAELLRGPGALSAALNWYRALPRDLVHPSVPIHRIATPTLYVWGERDPALGRAAAEATGGFVTGQYTFTILPRVGHWIPETASAKVSNALLSFWSEEVDSARGSDSERD